MNRIKSAPKISTWEQALYTDLGHPRLTNTTNDILWESGAQCMISQRTLWDVLRMATMWCHYVQYDLKQGDFHVGVVLFTAWQTTTQVEMATWRQLQKFKKKRNPQKHAEME